MIKYFLLCIPVYFFIIGFRYIFFTPDKDSRMAYRTPLSMYNEKLWNYSQKLYGQRLILGSIMMTPIVMIGFQIMIDTWRFVLFLVFEIIIAIVMAVSVGKTLAQKRI